MNSLKLLSNLPIEDLTEETDYLGILSKGDLIKQFLIGHKENADKIKMFALYGDWGSGKSTVMKYLKKNLSQDKHFNTFFFEAWEYERDDNLALSLLEFLKNETESFDEKYYSKFYENAKRVIKGIAKSVSIEVGIPKVGSISIEPGKIVEEFEKIEQDSFYKSLNELKEEFKTFENHLSNGDKKKYNIIFIDDLDRCEPKHVLDLLSSIKLFYTYGERTIFFCGVDKKAIEQAVKTQYSDIVKSEEYMEKIFDISFSMPKVNEIDRLISQYFDDTKYKKGVGGSVPIKMLVTNFFDSIEFTNPRKLKKVLNKFQIVRVFKKNNSSIELPDIDTNDKSEKSLFDTLLVLYLIILHEFFPSEFNFFLNFDFKKTIYSERYRAGATHNIEFYEQNLSQMPFSWIKAKLTEKNIAPITRSFNLCISPINLREVTLDLFSNKAHTNKIQMNPNSNMIEFLFYRYVNKYDIIDWMNCAGEKTSFLSTKKILNNIL